LAVALAEEVALDLLRGHCPRCSVQSLLEGIRIEELDLVCVHDDRVRSTRTQLRALDDLDLTAGGLPLGRSDVERNRRPLRSPERAHREALVLELGRDSRSQSLFFAGDRIDDCGRRLGCCRDHARDLLLLPEVLVALLLGDQVAGLRVTDTARLALRRRSAG